MQQFKFFLSFLVFANVVFSLPVNQGAVSGVEEKRADKKPSSDAVSKAVDNFAKDANTVSAALNSLPNMKDKKQIQSTAQKAFNAESDEDNQRSVLAAAAGKAGASSNSKIVKFTPAVLDGLQDIANKGTTDSVKQNIPAIEKARNPNILPSITQLSNSALQAMDIQKTAQKFPATGQNN